MADDNEVRKQYGLGSPFQHAVQRWTETESCRSRHTRIPQADVIARLMSQLLEKCSTLQDDEKCVRALKATDVLSQLFDPPTDKELLISEKALAAVLRALQGAIETIKAEEARLSQRGKSAWYRRAPPKVMGVDDSLLESVRGKDTDRIRAEATDPIVLLLVIEELIQLHKKRVEAARSTIQIMDTKRPSPIVDHIVMTLLNADVAPGDVSAVLIAKGFDEKVSSEKAINTRAKRLEDSGWRRPKASSGRGRPRSR